MILKAGLFLVIVALVGALLVARPEPLQGRAWTLALYMLGAWSFARAYYFAFYVIERYCDPTFRYAGVWSAVRWVLMRKR